MRIFSIEYAIQFFRLFIPPHLDAHNCLLISSRIPWWVRANVSRRYDSTSPSVVVQGSILIRTFARFRLLNAHLGCFTLWTNNSQKSGKNCGYVHSHRLEEYKGHCPLGREQRQENQYGRVEQCPHWIERHFEKIFGPFCGTVGRNTKIWHLLKTYPRTCWFGNTIGFFIRRDNNYWLANQWFLRKEEIQCAAVVFI